MNPIPISTSKDLLLLLLTMGIFLIVLLLTMILQRRKPRNTEPRKIFGSDGKEIIGFDVLLTVYFKENSCEAKLLEDIEAPEVSPPSIGFLSIPLPDIEF